MSEGYGGFRDLGAALFGNGGRTEAAYQDGLRGAAQTDIILAKAAMERQKAMEASKLRGKIVATGMFSPEEADFVATSVLSGNDPRQISGYRGDVQKQGFLTRADAAGDDWGQMNRNLALADGKPVALADVQDGMLIPNRYLQADQQTIAPTDIGRATISATQALAGERQSAATENYAQASAADALAGKYARTDPNARSSGGAAGGSNTLSPDVMEMFKMSPPRAEPGAPRVFNQKLYEQFLADRASRGATGNLSEDARAWLVAQQPQRPIIIDPTRPESMTRSPSAPAPAAGGGAEAIRAQYRAGKITREQARAQILALGIK